MPNIGWKYNKKRNVGLEGCYIAWWPLDGSNRCTWRLWTLLWSRWTRLVAISLFCATKINRQENGRPSKSHKVHINLWSNCLLRSCIDPTRHHHFPSTANWDWLDNLYRGYYIETKLDTILEDISCRNLVLLPKHRNLIFTFANWFL